MESIMGHMHVLMIIYLYNVCSVYTKSNSSSALKKNPQHLYPVLRLSRIWISTIASTLLEDITNYMPPFLLNN
jgi:hypothetical protein